MYETAEEYQSKDEENWDEKELKWLKAQTDLRKDKLINTIPWVDAKSQMLNRRKLWGNEFYYFPTTMSLRTNRRRI